MNYDELNTVIAILALLTTLQVPSWGLAVGLWMYIFATNSSQEKLK